jgi:tRNA-2-methylthio-N6-dimethylallyladenosine synthase
MPRRFHIITLGCQMNVYDSGRLAALLRKGGWEEAGAPSDADFVFLNTCSIREKAQKKVVARLSALMPLKKAKPSLLIGVGGCVAEQEGRELLKKLPALDLIAGPRRLPEIPQVLEGLSPLGPPAVMAGDSPLEKDSPGELLYPRGQGPSPISAFLTIMEGCDNFCAYCVVPLVRGRERGRDLADIVSEARALIAGGAREITLLGQNVNSYGKGSGEKPGLPFVGLLGEVAALPGLSRLRFTTSHPKDFPPELAQAMGRLPAVAPHVHLPLQSGSDRVLKAMGRGYDLARYLNILESLRESVPGIAVTTDMIVGFPGEEEEDFELTLQALGVARLDGMFSFKYSDRPGTRAPSLPGKVAEEVKAARLVRLIAFQKKISSDINRNLLGKTLEVLAEGRGREPGQLSGRSGTNKIVNFNGPDRLLGKIVRVTVTGASPVSLLAELPERAPTGALSLPGI